MILILELVESDFGHRLRSVLQKKGEKTLLLTSMRIVQEVFIAFNLDSQTSSFKLGYKDQVIHSEAIQGVYCGLTSFDQNPNHFLIQENPPGQPVGIGVIGKQWLPFGQASGDSFQPIDLEKVPHTLRKNIRSLHKHLHLNAAEYLFKRQEDVWTLIGVSHPPHFSLQAYQDEAYAALANFLSEGSKL